jgi:hypothetical protein
MNDMQSSNTAEREFIGQQYARADRFAWVMVVSLAFVGNIIAQALLHDLVASIILGALCFVGIVARELYLMWLFGGVPPRIEESEPKPSWRSIAARSLIIATLWLIPSLADGKVALRSILFAAIVAAGAAATFWWYEIHSAVKKHTV